MYRNICLSEICNNLKLELQGKDVSIDGLGFCNRENEYSNILSYATSAKYIRRLNTQQVRALVVSYDTYNEVKESRGDLSFILADDAETVFYDIHNYLIEQTSFYKRKNNKRYFGEGCSISDKATICEGVEIGDNVTIGAGSIVYPNSVIEDGVSIGSSCIIGGDGVQLIHMHGKNRLIHHTGGVRIGKGTIIRNNVIVCKSLFDGCTQIGENVIIDSLTCVAHNLLIGNNTVIVSGAFLCGGCIVGENVWIGPNSTIMNKVRIGNGAKIGIGSVVFRNVKDGTTVFGNPAQELKLPGYSIRNQNGGGIP